MVAETTAAALRKGNKGCRNKNHLKRDGPKGKKKKEREKICKNKKPPKICPCNRRGMHWAKDCKYIERKPIPENSKQGPPRSPSIKTWGKFHLLPEASTSGSAAIRIPALFLE